MVQGLQDFLVFEVADRRFGLPVEVVRELVRAVAITPLGRQPEYIEGMINLRGQVVPVLEFRRWMGLPLKPLEPADHFLVVNLEGRLLALRVDRALEIVPVGGEVLEKAAYLAGTSAGTRVAKFPEGLVVIPDLQTWLVHQPGFSLNPVAEVEGVNVRSPQSSSQGGEV